MPPKRIVAKSQQKKDVERQKNILSAKEKILAKKRFLLKIVEKMIEEDVSKDWFLNNCSYLCEADFQDVVQERSIENLCGYPLCSNLIQQTLKQKYHISRTTNKVYDLTERKCFCSNHCYKASNYVKAQLSLIPLYMRKDEKIKVHLLSDCDNKGSAGEEIVFHHKIPKDEVNKVFIEETSNNLQNLLNEEVKKCADSLSGLQIKEHLFEKQYVFTDETPNKSDKSPSKNKSGSYSESDFDSDDSIDEKLFPSYDNESALSNRHMPIPEKNKKSVLIPPQKTEIKSASPVNELSLGFVRKVFKDWITEDTLKYLMGEKYVYGVKADHLFKTMTETEFSCSEKLASIKDEYIKLCLKIDSLPDDDDDIAFSPEIELISEANTKSNSKASEVENASGKRIFKRRPKKSKDKNKCVTFAPEIKKTDLEPKENVESSRRIKDETYSQEKATVEQNVKENVRLSNETLTQLEANENISSNDKNEIHSKETIIHQERRGEEKSMKSDRLPKGKQSQTKEDENAPEIEKEPPSDLPDPEPTFPLIDSVSQNSLRRQVLAKKLKSVYTELLPVVGLHYTDIREDVRKVVDSLSLTPSNIIYKPKEWKLIALILFRMLTRTVLKDLHDELQFAKLCEDPLIPIAVDLREVENLVCELVSTENIISIY